MNDMEAVQQARTVAALSERKAKLGEGWTLEDHAQVTHALSCLAELLEMRSKATMNLAYAVASTGVMGWTDTTPIRTSMTGSTLTVLVDANNVKVEVKEPEK